MTTPSLLLGGPHNGNAILGLTQDAICLKAVDGGVTVVNLFLEKPDYLLRSTSEVGRIFVHASIAGDEGGELAAAEALLNELTKPAPALGKSEAAFSAEFEAGLAEVFGSKYEPKESGLDEAIRKLSDALDLLTEIKRQSNL